MRRVIFLCLSVLIAALPNMQGAPAPKRTNAKPAVINAGAEKHITWVLDILEIHAPTAVRQNEKVANMDIVRRQKDLEVWLKKNLRVASVKGKNLVHVSFQDGNPKEQATIINVVVDFYLNNDLRERRNFEKQMLKLDRAILDARRRAGRLAPQAEAEAEKNFKKREEYIRALPTLVEHAKAP